jgi:hypothetical protein
VAMEPVTAMRTTGILLREAGLTVHATRSVAATEADKTTR